MLKRSMVARESGCFRRGAAPATTRFLADKAALHEEAGKLPTTMSQMSHHGWKYQRPSNALLNGAPGSVNRDDKPLA
jgi:hypothetical protein